MAALLGKAAVAAGLLVIAHVLAGCGCDKDKGEMCANDFQLVITMNRGTASAESDKRVCKGYQDYASCVDDSSCCDFESNEGSIKTVMEQNHAILGPPCKARGAELTNPCAD
mmetsp:Transcript_40378/g.75529  ORF Transcript_40378/g.75529 Transcript_40378/m.75529 type:complete len:112 (-) Transcript_40378:56-391(-)